MAAALVRSPVGRRLVRGLLAEEETEIEARLESEGALYWEASRAALAVSSEAMETERALGWQDDPMHLPASDGKVSEMAARIARSAAVRWWSDSWDRREQIWLSRTVDPPSATRVAEPAKRKPQTALWTSSVVEGMPSAWWPVAMSGYVGKIEELYGWRIRMDPAVRVSEIRGPQDWRELCDRFPGPSRALRRSGPALVEPDWSSVACTFDAVHLTTAGLVTAQGVPVTIGQDVSMLWGWDAESTAWLSWRLVDATFLGTVSSARPRWNLSGTTDEDSAFRPDARSGGARP